MQQILQVPEMQDFSHIYSIGQEKPYIINRVRGDKRKENTGKKELPIIHPGKGNLDKTYQTQFKSRDNSKLLMIHFGK